MARRRPEPMPVGTKMPIDGQDAFEIVISLARSAASTDLEKLAVDYVQAVANGRFSKATKEDRNGDA